METLLKHASSASRLVVAIAVGPLADDIDAIVHELSELLGNPHLIAAPVPSARSTFAPDAVMRNDGAIAAGPLAEHIDTIAHGLSDLLGNPHLIAAPVPSACSTEPALGDDELTWPRVALRTLDAPGGAS